MTASFPRITGTLPIRGIIKPTFSLNYGIGYTVEMPPYNVNGGFQTVMVDQNDNILYAMKYLNSEKQAALQGNGYAPLIGFSIVDER